MSIAQRDVMPLAATPVAREADAFYHFCRWLPRTFWRLSAGLRIEGLHNVPATGPFMLVANHQSNLDPILIQASCPRIVATMAKSSQFNVPLFGPWIRRLYAFPVRRYQVDPQSVRTALRLLATGRAIAIYMEGERTWDGRMLPPRAGTTRLVLKAGVPVVPCAIRGAYDAWPRWARTPQRRPVTVAFGPPLSFPRLDHRDQREIALPDTSARLVTAIQALL